MGTVRAEPSGVQIRVCGRDAPRKDGRHNAKVCGAIVHTFEGKTWDFFFGGATLKVHQLPITKQRHNVHAVSSMVDVLWDSMDGSMADVLQPLWDTRQMYCNH